LSDIISTDKSDEMLGTFKEIKLDLTMSGKKLAQKYNSVYGTDAKFLCGYSVNKWKDHERPENSESLGENGWNSIAFEYFQNNPEINPVSDYYVSKSLIKNFEAPNDFKYTLTMTLFHELHHTYDAMKKESYYDTENFSNRFMIDLWKHLNK
jgi:hypothetical protein